MAIIYDYLNPPCKCGVVYRAYRHHVAERRGWTGNDLNIVVDRAYYMWKKTPEPTSSPLSPSVCFFFYNCHSRKNNPFRFFIISLIYCFRFDKLFVNYDITHVARDNCSAQCCCRCTKRSSIFHRTIYDFIYKKI